MENKKRQWGEFYIFFSALILHPIMYILSTKRYKKSHLKQGCLPCFLDSILKCRLCVEFCLPMNMQYPVKISRFTLTRRIRICGN